MKLDEIALNNVLKAYGHELKSLRPEKKGQKPDISTKIEDLPPQFLDELKVMQYDQNGQIKENPDKKKQLIDFFE